MISYMVNAKRNYYAGGKIEFETNDDETYEEVIKFINVYADACSWRNQEKEDEEEDEN